MTGVDPHPDRGWYGVRVAFIAAIGGFIFGFDLGMIGAANLYLREQFHLTDSQFGTATASAVLGCIFGPFLGIWLCDRIGRKRTMVAGAILVAINAVFTAVPEVFSDGSDASTMQMFNSFRFLGGLGVGLCSIASPMYIAETSVPARRGTLGLMYQLAIVVGHVAAPLIGFIVVYVLRAGFGIQDGVLPDSRWLQAWRWMFFSQNLSIVLFLAFVAGLPESPRWLATKERNEEALRVLTRMGGGEYARRELEQIRSSLQQESGGWREVFAPGMRYALLIGILLAFFNNWTGWSVIAGYIPALFEMSGLRDRALAIAQFAMTYLAMAVMTVFSAALMDRAGRRPLWIFASILMAIVTASAGFVFHFELRGWVVLVVLILVTVPHGIALGGIPWLMMSELFPTRIRAKAVAITTTVLWCFIYLAAWLFPTITGLSERHLVTARHVLRAADTISLVDADLDTVSIGSPEVDLIQRGFRAGQAVEVSGAVLPANAGKFAVHAVMPGQLVLESGVGLAGEKAEAGKRVTLRVSGGPEVTSDAVAFIDSNLDLIRDAGGKLREAGFVDGDRVTVIGTSREADSRTFASGLVTASEVILAPGEAVSGEPAGRRITLQVGSIGAAFWLFTAICILSLLFGLTIMPETKGRTLEEIAASWRKGRAGSTGVASGTASS